MRKSSEYRKIHESINGKIPIDAFGRSFDIHHIDGDYNNNSPENLKAVSIQEHYDIHYSQGDYSACHMIALRMNKTPEELSSLQKERVKNGTHNFLDPEFRKIHEETIANKQRERVANGTHNFLDPDFQKIATDAQRRRVNNGTHNWQDPTQASEKNKKRIREGTHHFIGDTNPGKIAYENGTSNLNDPVWRKEILRLQIERGTHNSQIKWKCVHCNKEGKGAGNYSRAHGDKCKMFTNI